MGEAEEYPTIGPAGLVTDGAKLAEERFLTHARTTEYQGQLRPTIDRYPILAKIGEGGMGAVYRAVNPRLNSEVAIKVLSSRWMESDPNLTKRFVREARLTAQVQSDNIVRVLDVDRDADAGCFYIVMDYVHGLGSDAWAKWVRSRGRDVTEQEALTIGVAMTRGICQLHRSDVVHRDIKPSNILIPCDPAPRLADAKVTDLGLAVLATAREHETVTGIPMGSPGYMPPEQVTSAASAKKPADVYGIAATIYSLLAGRPPIARESLVQTLVASSKGETDPLEKYRPDVTPETRALLESALQLDPEARPRDACLLLEQLEARRTAVQHMAPMASRSAPSPSAPPIPLTRGASGESSASGAPGSAPPGPPASSDTIYAPGSESLARSAAPSRTGLDVDGGLHDHHTEPLSRRKSAPLHEEAPTGFFDASLFQKGSLYQGSQVALTRVEGALSFYRNYLDAELKTLRTQARATYVLWVACVGIGFLALIAGMAMMVFGDLARGAVTSVSTVLVYFIQKIFQQREDHYRAAVTTKERHMIYANDWLVTMETIETMSDKASQEEERRRVVSILSDKLRNREELPAAPAAPVSVPAPVAPEDERPE